MNIMSQTGIKAVAVVIGVGAAGIAADWRLAASPSPSLVSPWKPDNLPRVEVVRPRRATVAQRLQTNATLEAFEETDLFAKVSGYLSDVRVDIGDHVKAGQVLAVIDIPEMKQELAEAKAELESKRSSLESARRQLDHNKADVALQTALAKDREQLGEGRQFISDRTLDQVHANADIAKADLGVAEANRDIAANQVDVAAATVEKIKTLLAYTQIVAPFDGVVARRQVNRGDLVQAATATRATPSAGSLFTVQRIDAIRVFCDVPENVPHVHIGDPAIVRPAGFDGTPFIGKVTRFSLRLDPDTRNMRTEIDLSNPNERLYPGTYAEVSLEMNRRPDALTVPTTAVGSDGEGNFVYTIIDNRITRLAVKTGLIDNGRIEVTAGLSEETPVLASTKSVPPQRTAVRPQVVRENS
ncbi:efflux RND transporter periplasmic adaptor subunit [Bradyrhizobium huanghuaihaiense]|uniref:efflux RND transporter periplasmic adaptor subunit n=1 Tax=Bradyrhizobium huanghuaihaiense TaxID=990078 RepID=UPI0021AAF200|nr:efflux RND transporter periplasmic adaptor subunit [Bradyrhizobium sp. CB3035]UWU76512.1 efflux RND transporter periplasmic adaptor subunit [Bradyrhizobium sp. CB3035]